MGTVRLERDYNCGECKMWGCDGHVAALEFQTTSEAYTFHVAGQTLQLGASDVKALLALLFDLAEERADSVDPRSYLNSLPWVSS